MGSSLAMVRETFYGYENHYFYSPTLHSSGCSACDCGVASDSRQCDDQTGLCRCKAGVTGRTCNKCAAGYWNYTDDGCVCKFNICA